MADDRQFTMSVPLDEDGFLRRECPNCEREFKWLAPEDEAEAVPAPVGGYYCPYCGLQAGANEWWTPDQLEHATAIFTAEVVDPMLRTFGRGLEGLNRGFVKITTKVSPSESPASDLTEAEDMPRIDFPCHPDAPIKMRADWLREVRCLICGSVSTKRP